MYYEEREPDVVVDVLGTDYSIYMNVPDEADKTLHNLSGYCDKTTKRIVVAKITEECNYGNAMEYVKNTLRHELIHAFLFESGLDINAVWEVDGQEHPEQMVEWIALQFGKIYKVFEMLDLL